jgi:hypothetical protein
MRSRRADNTGEPRPSTLDDEVAAWMMIVGLLVVAISSEARD